MLYKINSRELSSGAEVKRLDFNMERLTWEDQYCHSIDRSETNTSKWGHEYKAGVLAFYESVQTRKFYSDCLTLIFVFILKEKWSQSRAKAFSVGKWMITWVDWELLCSGKEKRPHYLACPMISVNIIPWTKYFLQCISPKYRL